LDLIWQKLGLPQPMAVPGFILTGLSLSVIRQYRNLAEELVTPLHGNRYFLQGTAGQEPGGLLQVGYLPIFQGVKP
jgi:hypothetical protein